MILCCLRLGFQLTLQGKCHLLYASWNAVLKMNAWQKNPDKDIQDKDNDATVLVQAHETMIVAQRQWT